MVFEDDWETKSDSGYDKGDAPEVAARNIMKRLGIAQLSSEIDGDVEDIEVRPEDWEKMDVELRGKRRYRKNKREQKRLDIDNLLARAQQWATDAFDEYAGDNPGGDRQDVAWDLAASAEYSFEPDEWEKLVRHFDEDGRGPDDLVTYIADMIEG